MTLLTESSPKTTHRSRAASAASPSSIPSRRRRSQSRGAPKSPKSASGATPTSEKGRGKKGGSAEKSKGGKKEKENAVCSYAPPCPALVLSWLAVLCVSLSTLTFETPSHSSNESDFSVPPSPTNVPVVIYRTVFAAVVFFTEAAEMMVPGSTNLTAYMPGSLLKGSEINTSGFRKLAYFTHWSWLSLGVYFLACNLNETGAFAPFEKEVESALWTVAAPNALLVTVIVTFVIWPTAIQTNGTEGLALW